MTLKEFKSVIDSTGIPFTYHHWKDPQPLPFGAWGIDGEPDFMADNSHYVPIKSAYVEYYSDIKNPSDEDKIKNAFIAHSIPYTFENEIYIEGEKMFMVRWSVQFIGG